MSDAAVVMVLKLHAIKFYDGQENNNTAKMESTT